jgi:hypothetical protein
MSFITLQAAICPCCGRDVARVTAAANGFRMICDPDRNGCGAEGAVGNTEAEGLNIWNAGLYASAGRGVAA